MRRTLMLGAAAAAIGLAFVSTSDPASARGCGGYVNQARWGCAVWDNNPKCPYHPDCARQQAPAQAVVNGRSVPLSSLRHSGGTVYLGNQPVGRVGAGGRLIAQGGGNLIAQGGGNLIAQGGGNIVSTGGGN